MQFINFSPAQLFLLMTFFAVFLFMMIHWLLGKILPRISRYSLITKVLWILCCIVIGICLLFVIPINTTSPSFHTLKVVATGQHNPQAKGSEVWLYSIQTGNGLELNRANLSLSQGWEYRDSTLLSYKEQPAIIEYIGFINGDLTLTFGSHPWSGQVRILLDDNEKVVDLYSANTTSKTIVLPIVSSPLLNFTILMAAILTLSFIVFIASVWFITGAKQSTEQTRNFPQTKDLIKPETAFLILAIFFGLLFVFITPPFQVADETQHFSYAYAISIGKFDGYRSVIPHSINDLMTATNNLPFDTTARISFRKLSNFINVPINLTDLSPSFYQGVAKVNPVPYLPTVIGFEIEKLLNLNTLAFFFFGRIFQLCVWILISYLALRLLPEFKWVFLLFILSPMSLSIASSYSADAITNSISFLWFSLCLYCSSVKRNEISSKYKFLLILIAALLSLMKPPYCLLLGIFFMIPRQNFGSHQQYRRTAALLFSISFIIFLFSISYLKNDVSNTNSKVAVDFMSQVHYLLNNPLEFPNIIVRSLRLFWKFYLSSYIGRLGWLDTVLPKYIYFTYPFIILLVSLIDQKKQLFFAPWQKLISFLIAGAVFYAIFLSLYLTWTPVGYKTLEGMQGRYLIPIGPVLLPLSLNNIFPTSKSWKSILVVVYLFIVLSITIRTLILRYYIA